MTDLKPKVWEAAAVMAAIELEQYVWGLGFTEEDKITTEDSLEGLRADLELLLEIGPKYHDGHARSLLLSLGATAVVQIAGPGEHDAVEHFVDKVQTTIVKKQHDYGHKNIEMFGFQGILVRVNDKIARLENLYITGGEEQNEPIEDSWLDIAGYVLIALMYMDGTFHLPLDSWEDTILPATPEGGSGLTVESVRAIVREELERGMLCLRN